MKTERDFFLLILGDVEFKYLLLLGLRSPAFYHAEGHSFLDSLLLEFQVTADKPSRNGAQHGL